MENIGRRTRLWLRQMSPEDLRGYVVGIKKSLKQFRNEMQVLYPGATIADSLEREKKMAKNILKIKMRKNE